MYLKHFGLREFPFSLTPDTQFFIKIPSHQRALNVLLIGLASGEGFIKIVGEVGTGKTILCRQLMHLLDKSYRTAYIPNPQLSPVQLYMAVADELGVSYSEEANSPRLLREITHQLIQAHENGKRVVLLLDEAQAMTDAGMEALRLLTNLETEKTKLLQVVLFGQPELDKRLEQPSLRQLRQRITFSYPLHPIGRDTLEFYVNHRLMIAGRSGCPLFKSNALKLLRKGSRGIPRLVNILCHKALMVAFGKGDRMITAYHIRCAMRDTQSVTFPIQKLFLSKKILLGALAVSLLIGGALFLQHAIR
ncbi:MAG: AAA family ATPase [Gammaproteobacteria bacterium]|nr:AAA family ATPase [Gammaproteobacteria bacterium]